MIVSMLASFLPLLMSVVSTEVGRVDVVTIFRIFKFGFGGLPSLDLLIRADHKTQKVVFSLSSRIHLQCKRLVCIPVFI